MASSIQLPAIQAAMIPIGTAREPVWPDGIAGSIAHSRGLAVAVVGWRKDFAGIGVDLEPETRRAGDQTIRRVCTPAELEWINTPGDPGLRAMQVFCSKEAAYKALSALGGARLGFRDVEFFPWRGATLFGQIKGEAAPGAPRRFTARTLVKDGYIVACVLVPS